jgi:catechol 2,3-dioxygenase-like lactoylglutathione lyase family enzyme
MEVQELHRGRLIDHIHIVVRDLPASRRFYEAIFRTLGVGIGGSAEDYFWVDELFVSTADSRAAQGKLTGRHHLAFQAQDRAVVEKFSQSRSCERRRRQWRTGGAPLSSPILRRVPD